MKKLLLGSVVAFTLSVSANAADQTWNGKISDSMCGAAHKTEAEHAKSKMSDRDCTLACINKGGKYVFVADGKVYNVENQSFADLKKHAGHAVKLSGTVKDETITVSKIEMDKAGKTSSE